MRGTEVVAGITARAPAPTRRLAARLLDHVRVPLHRDGYALGLNTVFTAAAGLIYWIVAAKKYSPHTVGLNSALISSMMFLAGISSLNLPNILVRVLPESGERTRRRVALSYGVAVAIALCAAIIYIVGVAAWAPRLRFLRSDHGLQTWFVLSTLAWCLFMIQDSVLTALGRAIWVPVENAVFSILKIVLLALLAVAAPVYGIFVSWTIAMLVSVAGVNILIFTRLMRRRPARRGDHATLPVRNREFALYFAGDYACTVAWMSTTNLMPVIVTGIAGATVNAYFALAYVLAVPLYLFGQNVGMSLTLHATTDRAALAVLTRKAAIQGGRILVPCVAVVALAAPYLLSPFGHAYAHHSAAVLRVLALGALANLVLQIAVSVARVQLRMRRVVIALATEAVLTLCLIAPLLHAFGVAGAAVAWVSAQVLAAGALLATWRTHLQPAVGGSRP
jgi:O-antigen/teichoic acid export membrane protein